MNLLYYGDNLDVLRRHVKDESVDLVYLDPPFNSNQDYNVLFAEREGGRAAAQIKAFEDTWTWDEGAERSFVETVEAGGLVSDALRAYRTLLGSSDMMAYLAMMAPRLVELRRVMKPTASIYLHCDPTASHYLKVLLDAVFGATNFRNELIWRRTGTHGKGRRFGPIHDVILFYAKASGYTWTSPKRPYMRGHVTENFVLGEDGTYRTNYSGNVLTGSGTRGGESGKLWRGFDPTAKGRHWAVPGKLLEDIDEDFSALGQHEKLDRLYELGWIRIEEGQVWPVYDRILKPTDGQTIGDIWACQPYTKGTVFGTDAEIDADVRWLATRDQERLGYPTQKPVALLERIISASSVRDGVVLDPFCGCGTTIAAAQKLGRKWIGIDITHLAINLIKTRLRDQYGVEIEKSYKVLGEPVSIQDAEQLAEQDPYQFQWWALGLVGARGTEQKKGADKGIDGKLIFHDEGPSGKTKQIVFSVKAGHLLATHVRDLRGVVDREEAAIGVLLSLEEPTKLMKTEAASAGFYSSPWGKHPKLQLITVGELLAGKRPDLPTKIAVTFKQAPRILEEGENLELLTTAIPTPAKPKKRK